MRVCLYCFNYCALIVCSEIDDIQDCFVSDEDDGEEEEEEDEKTEEKVDDAFMEAMYD